MIRRRKNGSTQNNIHCLLFSILKLCICSSRAYSPTLCREQCRKSITVKFCVPQIALDRRIPSYFSGIPSDMYYFRRNQYIQGPICAAERECTLSRKLNANSAHTVSKEFPNNTKLFSNRMKFFNLSKLTVLLLSMAIANTFVTVKAGELEARLQILIQV